MMEQKQIFPIFKNIDDLHYSTFGFKESDLEKEFTIPYSDIKLGIVHSKFFKEKD